GGAVQQGQQVGGAAELVVAAFERLAVQRGGAELVRRDRDEPGDPGREGGLEGGQVEQGEQVAEGAVGGRLAEEAQGAEECRGLVAGPLGEGGVGDLPAQDGGASRGEQGEQREAPPVGAAGVGDRGEVGQQATGGQGGHGSSSTTQGLPLHAYFALLPQDQ